MNVRLELDLKDFIKELDDIARNKLPAAFADALNHTAAGARIALQKEMDDSFRPKPTPYIRNSVRTHPADKQNLEAIVFISDVKSEAKTLSPQEILKPHVYGGPRESKKSEYRLRDGFMGRGQYMVPGIGAPRNIYRDISGGQMQRILGFIKAYRELGYNKTSKTNRYYVVPFVGVFKKTGRRSSVPILHFTYKKPFYEQRFDFHYTVANHVKKTLLKNVVQAWGSAMLKRGYYGR